MWQMLRPVVPLRERCTVVGLSGSSEPFADKQRVDVQRCAAAVAFRRVCIGGRLAAVRNNAAALSRQRKEGFDGSNLRAGAHRCPAIAQQQPHGVDDN